MMKDFASFEDFMDKNPQEWKTFTEVMKEEGHWKEVEEEIDRSVKGTDFSFIVVFRSQF